MDSLDEALEGGGAASSEGDAAGGQPGGQGETIGRAGAPGIQWEEGAQGRGLLSDPDEPDIPTWVQRQGLYLTVTVVFDVTPAGRTTNLRVATSSGYPEVDAAVLDTVRSFQFNPTSKQSVDTGRIRYIIDTK
jgi:TonB family protein